MNFYTNILVSNNNNPFFNLATEEWLINNYDASNSDLLFLYVNNESVVVGRNQNLLIEVNFDYCKKNNFSICRRISGGGTVFQDAGNLNWCKISKFDFKKVNKYEYFAQDILDLVGEFNLKAYLNSRNGIEVDGLKVSGQAQFTNKKNILSHGTLLVDSDLEKMQPAILPDAKLNVQTKASKSVRSQIANINELATNQNVDISKIIDLLSNGRNKYELTDSALNEIELLEKKYKSDEWIYNRSPKSIFTWQNNLLHIEKGIITKVASLENEEIVTHYLVGKEYKSLFESNLH